MFVKCGGNQLAQQIFASFTKIVSKVLVKRLKEIIHTTMTSFQTELFVLERYIDKNIIVAREMVHNMNKMQDKKGYLIN